jgi:chromatin remodeling complex protein RSC6
MATTSKPATARKPNAAFMKPLTPSAELAAVIGSEAVPRTEVTKKIWEYIKKHNLQDASNKRNINADAKLKELFGKPQVSMFELAGLIGKHVK